MANVGKLNIIVGASVGGLQKGLTGAAKTVRGFSGTVSKGLGGLGGMLAGLGLASGMHSAAESIDKVAKGADSLGIGTEELVGLHHAGDLAGVSAEQLNTGLGKMLKTIGEASTGSKSAEKSLGKLGLSTADLAGLGAAEQFGLIADRISAMTDPAERAAAAMSLFGRGGMAMVPLMLEGSAGLAAARTEAELLNLSFSRTDASKIEQANDAISKLKAAVSGSFRLFIAEIAGGVSTSAETSAFKFAEIARAGIGAFKRLRDNVAFFIGTWSLQWNLIKSHSALVWDTLKAGAVGYFAALVAGLVAIGHNFMAAFENFPKIAVASWEAIAAGAVALYQNISGVFQDMGATVMAFASATVDALKAAFNLENPLTAFRDSFAKTFSEKSSGAFSEIGTASSKAFADSIAASGGLKEFESVSGAMGEAFNNGFAGAIDPTLDAEHKKILDQISTARAEFDAMNADAPGAGAKAAADGASSGTGAAATVNAVSTKLAAATTFGTTEAASQINAAMAASRGKDDKVVQHTERTADNTGRIADALENLEPANLDLVEAF